MYAINHEHVYIYVIIVAIFNIAIFPPAHALNSIMPKHSFLNTLDNNFYVFDSVSIWFY